MSPISSEICFLVFWKFLLQVEDCGLSLFLEVCLCADRHKLFSAKYTYVVITHIGFFKNTAVGFLYISSKRLKLCGRPFGLRALSSTKSARSIHYPCHVLQLQTMISEQKCLENFYLFLTFYFFFLNHDEKIILEVFMKLTSKTFFLCHLEFFDIKKNY